MEKIKELFLNLTFTPWSSDSHNTPVKEGLVREVLLAVRVVALNFIAVSCSVGTTVHFVVATAPTNVT